MQHSRFSATNFVDPQLMVNAAGWNIDRRWLICLQRIVAPVRAVANQPSFDLAQLGQWCAATNYLLSLNFWA
jgi:hypothetical protein